MSRTLDNFRDDVQSAIGERGIANAKLNRFINDAYLDVCKGVDFEDLEKSDTSQTTVDGTEDYDVPTGSLVVKGVIDTTNDNLLEFITKYEFYRRRSTDASDEGEPTEWTRHIDKIKLHPVPDDAYALEILYKVVPTLLSADADTLAIPEVWDPVVLMLAIHYSFLSLGEEDRAMVYFQRAVAYIQSCITEADYFAETLSLGVSKAFVNRPGFLGQLGAKQTEGN